MSKFGGEQERVKQRLLEMSSLVEQAIELSVRAITHRDRAAADRVFTTEVEINRMEVEIDDQSINLLALHQPMATNLRFLIAILKIVPNLERMGDLSVNIAHTAKVLLDRPAAAPIVDIPLMAGLVRSMVRKSIDAFALSDAAMAEDVLASDDEVDTMRTSCFHQLVAVMQSDAQRLRHALSLLTVTRTLERIADHATNIAEDVLFYVQGIDVRHRPGAERGSGSA